MKKIYIAPELDIINTDNSVLLAGSPSAVATFGNLSSQDEWQNENVSNGSFEDGNNYSTIEDDEDGLISR